MHCFSSLTLDCLAMEGCQMGLEVSVFKPGRQVKGKYVFHEGCSGRGTMTDLKVPQFALQEK